MVKLDRLASVTLVRQPVKDMKNSEFRWVVDRQVIPPQDILDEKRSDNLPR